MAGINFFSDILGQEKVLKILERLITADRFLPLVFVGQTGVGKRTLALKLTQAVNCEKIYNGTCSSCSICQKIATLTHPDIRLIFPIHKPSSDSRPEDTIAEMINQYPNFTLEKPQPSTPANYIIPIAAIRWIASEINKPPVSARKRCYIILNAHRMNAEAQNALLKIIEETRQHTIFILTTTNQYSLYPTIRSRCQTIRFANFSDEAIISFLEKIRSTNRLYDTNPDLSFIAAVAQGSLGRALSIYRSIDEYALPPLLNFFKTPNYKTLLSILDDCKNIEQPLVNNTAIHQLRNHLYKRLDYNFFNHPTDIKIITEMLSYLYERYHQASLNVNPILANYCTLRKLSEISGINKGLNPLIT